MIKLETEIDIHATPQQTWAVLTDFASYGAWNPFITRIEGPLQVGGTLTVVLHQKGSKPMTIKPQLQVVELHQRLGWLGRLLVPGLADGAHWFELEDLGPGRVRFRHYEHFSGVLAPFLRGMLQIKTRPAFEAMNRALKDRVEAMNGGS